MRPCQRRKKTSGPVSPSSRAQVFMRGGAATFRAASDEGRGMTMKGKLAAVAAVAVFATGGAVVWSGAAFAAGRVSCTGTLAGRTINGNVTVPNGSFCRIENQTINGNITVEPGGGLVVRGS